MSHDPAVPPTTVVNNAKVYTIHVHVWVYVYVYLHTGVCTYMYI